jgi:acetyl-CoA carboxylase biotin carboxyl carrier protein
VSLRFDEIAEILKIIDSSSCDEVIIDSGDIKLVVRRNGVTGNPIAEVNGQPVSMATRAPASQALGPAGAALANSKLTSGQIEVIAPMVGTFYRAPTPDAPPFVEIGTEVKAGQPLCLIEVMKLFTTINSEVAGRVVQIGAENSELVEYGRTLFVIEPDQKAK